jgi:hypothetical protein
VKSFDNSTSAFAGSQAAQPTVIFSAAAATGRELARAINATVNDFTMLLNLII